MTKKVDTWMPLLVDKYLGDTMLLTTEQHGAYLLLLMSMWKKDGRLPDNDQQLAQAARLTPAKWRATRPILIDGVLLKAEDGFVTQKRLSAELARSKAHTEAKAKAGAKGAEKRWQNDSEAEHFVDGMAVAEAWHEHSQTGASRSTPIPKHPSDAPVSSATSDDVAPAQPAAEPLQLGLDGTPSKPGAYEAPDCPHREVLAVWAEVLPEMPQHRPDQWNGARADHLRARWRAVAVSKKWPDQATGLDFFRRLFAYVGQSDFLCGRTGSAPGKRPFTIELEWLVTPANWAKVIEGKYHRDGAAA